MNKAPVFTVGISGHRPNRMAIGVDEIARRLYWTLAGLRSGYRAAERVAVSALAEGSDRLFAEAALSLGYRLDVVLPFKSADYETTFSDAQSTPAYDGLLARADRVDELDGTLDDTKTAYERVGRETVRRADVLITVWDGEGAAGRGGTSEIIQLALDAGKPVIWIDAARLRLPRLIGKSRADAPREVPLAKLAARARPLTRRRIVAIAASNLNARR
jgi:hypothetical protein